MHNPPHAEDFAYFYDTIHGRVSFTELPPPFLAPLRTALNSAFLNRLTRISQLGYTSLTFFSATQTRFSHAIGTLVMMNRLISQIWGSDHSIGTPKDILVAVKTTFPNAIKIGNDPLVSIRCHLLLAAFIQDTGELPFQKITSHYFRPTQTALNDLGTRLTHPTLPRHPQYWKTKDAFTILCVAQLLQNNAFNAFDLTFLTFLLIDKVETADPKLMSLRQMVNGVIDADRLDYVYRDAHLTIGALTKSDTVIRTIVRYEANRIVVDDARPVTDFLTTRARLWSFVYSSPAVRFRQTLLKSFFQAAFASQDGIRLLERNGLPQELSLSQFIGLDDHSMLSSIRRLDDGSRNQTQLSRINKFGQVAREIMLKPVSDYECRILEQPQHLKSETHIHSAIIPNPITLLPEVFFDLQSDHDEEHKLYSPGSVVIEQRLTERMKRVPVPLEQCSGALSSVFGTQVSVPLVSKSFLLFLPEANQRNPADYTTIASAMSVNINGLYHAVDTEDVGRELAVPFDTWKIAKKQKRNRIAISCCFKDRTHIIRIVQHLHAMREPYRVLLDSLLWLGFTSEQNSKQLINTSDAVLIVMSQHYIDAWQSNPEGNIAVEIREMLINKTQHRKAVVPLIPYTTLNDAVKHRWIDIDKDWTAAPIIGSSTNLRTLLEAACSHLNS